MNSPLYLAVPGADSAPCHDEIAARAYQLWSDSGHPEGRNDEIWLEAEHRLIITAETPPNLNSAILQTLRHPVAPPAAKSGPTAVSSH
ncbi:MAG: DUF2934 domain-containing protein [Opitutaceae bacterium]